MTRLEDEELSLIKLVPKHSVNLRMSETSLVEEVYSGEKVRRGPNLSVEITGRMSYSVSASHSNMVAENYNFLFTYVLEA